VAVSLISGAGLENPISSYCPNYDDDTTMERGLAEELSFDLNTVVNEKALFAIISQFVMRSERVFGPQSWRFHYNVNVGSVPRLPRNFFNFWLTQEDSSHLPPVLCPQFIDGQPFTLRLLGQLVKKPQNGGHASKYAYQSEALTQHQNTPAGPACWLVMRKSVGARDESEAAQVLWIQSLNAGYETRPRAIHLATIVFTRHVLPKGERYLSDGSGQEGRWSVVRCRELLSYGRRRYPLAVGGFAPGGLLVDCPYYDQCVSVALKMF